MQDTKMHRPTGCAIEPVEIFGFCRQRSAKGKRKRMTRTVLVPVDISVIFHDET